MVMSFDPCGWPGYGHKWKQHSLSKQSPHIYTGKYRGSVKSQKLVLSKVGIFFRHVILFLNQPNDERYRTKYVPGAEIAAFVNIDTDKFEERFNAQCIQY